MKSEIVNLEPARQLLERHKIHTDPYPSGFRGLNLIIQPDVFNPDLTKVSGFLADNITITPEAKVLDMFTGCGVIAILAAKNGASSVAGVDISAAAVNCAKHNAFLNGVKDSVRFIQSNLWEYIPTTEKYDIITANPPLLPVHPETLLEMAIADSPDMNVTKGFLQECKTHMADKNSIVYMTFSNACKAYHPNPVVFIERVAQKSGLKIDGVIELDVGYEIYRVIKFMLN